MSHDAPAFPARPQWRQSLATRLTWLPALVVGVVVAVVGAGLILIAGHAQRESAFVLQQQRALQAAQLISGHIGLAADRLQFFLRHEDLLAMPPPARAARLENLLLVSQPRYGQISLLGGDGQELAKVSRFHTYLPRELGNRAGEDFFAVALGGGLHLGQVEVAADSGLLSLNLALPITDSGGRPRGVLLAEVNISQLWREVAGLELGPEGYAFLVDRGGKFLAFHKPATILQRHGEDMSRLPPVAAFTRAAPAAGAKAQEYRGLDSEPVVGALAPIQDTQWAVVVEWPTRRAYADLRLMQTYLAGLAMAAMLLAGGAGYFIGRRLVRPIRALTEAAGRMGSGDLDASVPMFPGGDEVGLLSASFNRMRAEVKRLYAGLAAKVAELERTQEALGRSEAHYRAIFDHSVLGIFQSTPDGRFLSVNPAFCRMLGYASPEAVTDSISDVGEQIYLHPQDRRRLFSLLHNLDRVEDFVTQLKRKDGEVIWVSITARAVRDAQGGVAYLEGMNQDITARRKAEEELREKTEELDRYFTSSLDLLCIADTEGYFHRLNPEWERTLGYSLDELEGRRFLDFVHPEDQEATLAAVANLSAGQEVIMFLNRYRHRDGSYRWIEWRSYPAGGLIYAAARDITERKLAEDRLRQNEERLRAILEASPHPVVVYDTDGAATFVNPAFSRVFGWEAHEVLGRRIPFVPPEYREQSSDLIHRLYQDGGTITFETVRLTKEGRALNIFGSAAGIQAPGGRVTGMVVSLTDLTPLKGLEAQLRQAQKMEAIGTLAGGIAHDFNNILGAVMGYTEKAKKLSLEGRACDAELDQVLMAAERARHLIRQILTFSHKDQGGMRPVDLNRSIEDTLRILEYTLPRMIGIQTELAPNLPPVLADPNQMAQVVMNLATNAADAMPQGGDLVIGSRAMTLDRDYCQLHPQARPGDYVVVTVSDTGQGMNPSTLEHIFDPFFTTKEVGKGTGLGLSTVYGIAKHHGGWVQVDSRPGSGATFAVFLPAHHQSAPPPRRESGRPLQSAGRGETIMVVDDEESLRRVTVEALLEQGYQVLSARTGEEALALYGGRAGGVDLVILDLGMPGMGGGRCLKEILALDPGARIIIASGYAPGEQVQQAMEAGARGYLAKPFRLADLLAAVKGELERE